MASSGKKGKVEKSRGKGGDSRGLVSGIYSNLMKGLTVLGIAGLTTLSGCYTNKGIRNPDPEFEKPVSVEEDFDSYVRRFRNIPYEEDIDEKEHKYYRYLDFLEEIAGGDLEKDSLDIVPQDAGEALLEDFLPGPFLRGGVYWYGDVKAYQGRNVIGQYGDRTE
ncbi:MAG: hypothetical protein SVV03_00355 [Candidatus Nanohaloarchaea archaeon]|nr:hypothetical protein [Candidatus Nanohaloarchaea archaeon]